MAHQRTRIAQYKVRACHSRASHAANYGGLKGVTGNPPKPDLRPRIVQEYEVLEQYREQRECERSRLRSMS